MNCKRCGSANMKPDGGYLICTRCGAQLWAGLSEKQIKKELPTEEEMINCPRGT